MLAPSITVAKHLGERQRTRNNITLIFILTSKILTPPERGNFGVDFLWQRSARHEKATEKLLAVTGLVMQLLTQNSKHHK